jgi:hypothetical protein
VAQWTTRLTMDQEISDSWQARSTYLNKSSFLQQTVGHQSLTTAVGIRLKIHEGRGQGRLCIATKTRTT